MHSFFVTDNVHNKHPLQNSTFKSNRNEKKVKTLVKTFGMLKGFSYSKKGNLSENLFSSFDFDNRIDCNI